VITNPEVIRAILDRLFLSSIGSARSPPRARSASEPLDDSMNEVHSLESRFVPDPG
jgi:hypothetical protein